MKINLRKLGKISFIMLIICVQTLSTFMLQPAQAATKLMKINADPGKITGKILDENGLPIPGATITLVQTNQKIQSSTDGTFSFNLAPGTYTLNVSYLSYQQQKIENITVKSGENNFQVIKMLPDQKSLSEIVVVGYGTQKKENLTGAVDQITAKALENRPLTNLTQGLQGALPNLNLKMMDGRPTQSPVITLEVQLLLAKAAMHWYLLTEQKETQVY